MNGWNHQGKIWGPMGPQKVVYDSDVCFILCYKVIFHCSVAVPSICNKMIDAFGSNGSSSGPLSHKKKVYFYCRITDSPLLLQVILFVKKKLKKYSS